MYTHILDVSWHFVFCVLYKSFCLFHFRKEITDSCFKKKKKKEKQGIDNQRDDTVPEAQNRGVTVFYIFSLHLHTWRGNRRPAILSLNSESKPRDLRGLVKRR